MNKKLFFILFGSTGNLVVSKVLPALEKIPYDLEVVAIGRRNWNTKEYIEFVKEHHNISIDFSKKINYVKADISDQDSLIELKNYLMTKGDVLSLNKIFFFATHSDFYENITSQIKKLGLNIEGEGFSRAIFEKPFGNDLRSATEINKTIKTAFLKKQIFRIDHYLGKEIVQKITNIRLREDKISSLWNNKHIEYVQIIIDEEKNIGNRGQYYDKTGALKDMLQNHIIQIISLLFMEHNSSETINQSRSKIIKKLKKPIKILLGQYQDYKKELHVDSNSLTETLLAMKLEIDDSDYRGIPIYVRTGKALEERNARIGIKFKEHKRPLLLHIQPVKKIEFPHEEIIQHFNENTAEGYEKLISELIQGIRDNFVDFEELKESWKFMDSIYADIDDLKKNQIIYKQNKIPTELIEFIKEDFLEWI